MFRACVCLLAFLMPALASAQMPDVSQMSGVPLPMGDLPNGTVSVRVVRGDLSNNVVNHPVELHGGGQTWRATTDAEGRAQFSGIAPGTSVHAVTTVDGQQLESQDFAVPAEAGMRVVLVAGAATGGGAPAAGMPPGAGSGGQAVPGSVNIGAQSRVIVELIDGSVEVYFVLDFVNEGTSVVSPAPVRFEFPEYAKNATVLQGSEALAKAEGRAVTIAGSFPPGRTQVQFAYQIEHGSSRVDFEQTFPVSTVSTAVIVRKIGDVSFTSPQTPNQSPLVQGTATYIIGNGPGLTAGSTLQVSINGLPFRRTWPRNLALALSLLIVGAGFWIATSGDDVAGAHRQKLEKRREQLFAELVKLEEQHRAGRGDPQRYAAKRGDVVEQLERIYADLEALPAA